MGAGASIASVSSELLDLERNAIGSQRNIVVPKLISNEQLLNEIKRRSTNPDSGRKFSFSKRRPTIDQRYEIPQNVNSFLSKIGINETTENQTAIRIPLSSTSLHRVADVRTSKLVEHIFDCLGALQHLVRANQFGLGQVDYETQSMCDQNQNSIGKLIHEMVSIYGLCGDTLRVLLNSNPEAASIEVSIMMITNIIILLIIVCTSFFLSSCNYA